MYKLDFTLKQHTPIIHFQHDQEGATLRATEVKPKLDRFLIELLGDADALRDKHPDWFSSKKHNALDYKIKIRNSGARDINQRFTFSEDTRELDINKKYKQNNKQPNYSLPMVLANMAGKQSKNELKDAILFEKVQCELITYHPGLMKELKNEIIAFFATHNFGNRSNKGFGSYSVVSLNNVNIAWNDAILPKGTHYLELYTNENRKIFECIDFFYKWLKSGINYTSFKDRNGNRLCDNSRYLKSMLYQYLDSDASAIPPKYSWEKRWLKENYFSLAPLANNPKFARGIIGLSDKFEFTKANCNANGDGVPVNQDKTIFTSHNGNEIDRIKSPIIFKPINIDNNTRVFLLIDDSHVDSIYANGVAKDFLFAEKEKFDIEYTLYGTHYSLKYKLGENISKFDEHINRLQHQTDVNLVHKLHQLQQFKNSIKTLPLPDNRIDFNALFQFIKGKHPTFTAKDFYWNNIIQKPISIKTTL